MPLASGFAKAFDRGPHRNAGARLGVAVALVLNATAGALAQAPAEPSASGFWQAKYDDGKPSGWFYFTEHNGTYEGRIVKGFKKTPDEPVVLNCVHCPGDKKNTPMLGLVIVWGMKRHGLKYDEGSIMDPRDGSIYHANMQVSPDGQKLFVRGYLGVELLGQTQTWERLPDNTMAASAIPGEPVVAAQTKKKPPVPGKPASATEAAPAAPAEATTR
jgi:uncharacterized protein (DUF2147 family)